MPFPLKYSSGSQGWERNYSGECSLSPAGNWEGIQTVNKVEWWFLNYKVMR